MNTPDFFSPGAIEAYKVVGVPLLALIVVVFGIGWRIEVLSRKVDDMKDGYTNCLKDLSVDVKENTVETKNIGVILREMRDIEREKLSMRKEEKETEVRKIA